MSWDEIGIRPAATPDLEWNIEAVHTVLEVVRIVCEAHQVWPADLLNPRSHRGGNLHAARRELYRRLHETLRYTPGQHKCKAQVHIYGGRELSYPAIAALTGAACHQRIMRIMKEGETI